MGKVALIFVCGYVAFMPSEMLYSFESISAAKLIGIVVCCVALLAFAMGHPVRFQSKAVWLRLALVAWASLSFVWSLAPDATWDTIPRQFQVFLLYLLIWEFAVTNEDQLWVLRSLLFGMLFPLSSQFRTFGHFTPTEENAESARISGGGHDLNYMALMLAVTIVIAAYFATSPAGKRGLAKWFYWGYVCVAVLGALLTGSRGGLFALLLAGIFSLLVAEVSLKRIWKLGQYIVPIILLVVAARYIVPAALQSRLLEGEGADTLTLREAYWARGLLYSFAAQPVGGVGLGAYGPATTMLTQTKTGPAHNLIISILVEIGVVGLALFLYYIFTLLWSSWHLPRREKFLCLGVLCVWLLGAMSSGSQLDKFSWILQAVVAARVVTFSKMRSAATAGARLPARLPQYPAGIPARFKRS